jgi:hypothetical protein
MITTISTNDRGWRRACVALAEQGCHFTIDRVVMFPEISFCNALAAAHGYHVSVQRGVATFSKAATETDEQDFFPLLPEVPLRNRPML